MRIEEHLMRQHLKDDAYIQHEKEIEQWQEYEEFLRNEQQPAKIEIEFKQKEHDTENSKRY